MAAILSAKGDPVPFFIGLAIFYVINLGINWWYYARRGAEKPC